MGPVKISGLPAHVLLVHAVVVLVPLTCACLVATAWWPAARRRLGVVTPLLALACAGLVPVTTHAGQWLRDNLGVSNALILKHTRMGNGLLPWVAGVLVLAVVQWLWFRRVTSDYRSVSLIGGQNGNPPSAVETRTEPAARIGVVTGVLGVLAIALAVGTVWQVYRIGDSGAHAVWNGVVK
jgi:hypothetical protein